MNLQYTQYTLLPQDVANLYAQAETQAIEHFHKSIRKHRTTYNSFVGQDGNDQELSWSTRRRIASALRQSCRVLGMGQKSRIGRLGGGAAIGAIIAGFATPAMAQYAAGGGTSAGVGAVAIGTGSTSTNISAVAIGNSNAATSNDVLQQQILDRALGGLFSYPTGQTFVISVGGCDWR